MAGTWMFRDILEFGGPLSCAGNDMLATLDDAAATSIQTSCNQQDVPAVNGTFTPEQPLSAFDGMAIAGTWNLVVDDDSNVDTGQVNQWCVHITPE